MKWTISALTVALVVLGFAGDGRLEAQRGGPRFEITVTNLTAAQVFTPIIAASHRQGVRLFAPGEMASVELEVLAEGGDTAPLMTALANSPRVRDVVTAPGPLPPGQSMTLVVRTGGGFDHVSLTSMLVPTNDAFFAVNGVEGPNGRHTVMVLSPAYDAGTEMNDESCAAIPGPPAVCQGEGFNPSRAGAEGFVHVHRGIHGAGDLSAAAYDWRNPVARIMIRRLP